jgi:hypothetical protein
MAGVKITALPELLTRPITGDKLVVVDVSDTSEAPTGTTKQFDQELLQNLVEVTKSDLAAAIVASAIDLQLTYRITDAAQGVIRVFGKSTTELTATAMLEGVDDGTGSITSGQWGNYDLDGDVFTSVLGVEGNSQITNGAVYSQGDVSGLQSILTFAEDFAMKSIDNVTGDYSSVLCSPSAFNISSFDTASGKTIQITSTSGTKIEIKSNDVSFMGFNESSGDAQIGFFDKMASPIIQQAAIANATDAPSAITQLNLLLTAMRNYGLIAE